MNPPLAGSDQVNNLSLWKKAWKERLRDPYKPVGQQTEAGVTMTPLHDTRRLLKKEG